MCGVAGILKPGLNKCDLRRLSLDMGRTLLHRGPDHGDIFVDRQAGFALSHRRLAIIDTSPAGQQPMISACGRFVIAFNGEIYNFRELRAQLDKEHVNFRSASDTEVFLEYIAAYGVAKACHAANGMFAFAIWDRRNCTLTLGRDRFGQKPIYYGNVENGFYFASELKAIRQVVTGSLERDEEALSLFLRHGYIPAPWSIYRDIRKLEPGRILKISSAAPADWHSETYWSAVNCISDARQTPFTGTFDEAVDEIERLAKVSVEECMISDVPLGALLSGGIDSSIVSALMTASQKSPVKTFSIGFDKASHDESKYAEGVAQHLKTNHTTLHISEDHLIGVIPELASLYDEPFADSSQIPTYLVSKLAQEHVSVALTGDGGDEVFGGYTRYAVGQLLNQSMLAPALLRRAASRVLLAPPTSFWDSAAAFMGGPVRLAGDKVTKLARILCKQDFAEAYVSLTSNFDEPADLLQLDQHPNWQRQIYSKMSGLNSIHRMMATDTLTYLADDILAKVDRASMAVSLETRIPLLDHRLFEFSWRLPLEMHSKNQVGKRVLRSLANRHVPKEIMDRPKMGFAIPLADWLRTRLRDWAEELIDPFAIESTGLKSAPIIRLWEEHLSGKRDHQHALWTALMFLDWERRWN